jgi:hypothetical protein
MRFLIAVLFVLGCTTASSPEDVADAATDATEADAIEVDAEPVEDAEAAEDGGPEDAEVEDVGQAD